MRLSDAGLCRRQTKALDPNHRLPPSLNEDVTRDRSNRLLGPQLEARSGPGTTDKDRSKRHQDKHSYYVTRRDQGAHQPCRV
jgi:hypothetical protein